MRKANGLMSRIGLGRRINRDLGCTPIRLASCLLGVVEVLRSLRQRLDTLSQSRNATVVGREGLKQIQLLFCHL